MLGVPEDVPVITRDRVARAKPDPDLFLAGAEALGIAIEVSVVVGDSVWDPADLLEHLDEIGIRLAD
jgi:beta-phosphoglucomutase-like phosphatase (HAD superfamily)